jgi:hypothetical protein
LSDIKDKLWDGWVKEDVVILLSLLEKVSDFGPLGEAEISSHGTQVSGAAETSPGDSSLCQSWIRTVARQTGTLPITFILKGVRKESENAVGDGGFAEVYIGLYAGQKVALKVLSIGVKEDRRKIIKVCFVFAYNARSEISING